MTKTQFATLQWLSDIGGTCMAWRDKVVAAEYVQWHATFKQHRGEIRLEGAKKFTMPAVSALHLVMVGCIEGRDGRLHLTDKGRAHLRPFGSAA
jgi:hypothetical protein